MGTTTNHTFNMVRGDTLSFGFEIQGTEQLDTAYFSCKTDAYDSEYVFQKSLNDGITAAGNGKYRVRVAPGDTADIEAGTYYYDLEIGENGDIYTILKGKLKIDQDITRGQ